MKPAVLLLLLSLPAFASDLRVIDGKVYNATNLPDICKTVGRKPEQFRANQLFVAKQGVEKGKPWIICDVKPEELGRGPNDCQIIIFNLSGKFSAGDTIPSCRALRVSDYTTWRGTVMEAYDCGVPVVPK